jgi:hypothetical protein
MAVFKNTTLGAACVLTALALSGAAPATQPKITFVPPAESVCTDCAAPNGQPNPAPPAGFNALAASNNELQRYGFPPRPDKKKDPSAYAFWTTLVTLPAKRVIPKQQATTLYNGPAMITSISQTPHNFMPTGTTTKNWSGYANVAADGHYPFRPNNTYVYGVFSVPVAQQAYFTCSATSRYASFWVGIDGFNSADVMQAGIEADATCGGGITTGYYSAWYEWYPFPETRISSPAVGPGDEIYVYVWNSSPTLGNYYMVNYTENEASSLSFSAPSGTHLVGNSVEWIAERPSVGGHLATLTNYIANPWFYAFAHTAADHYYSAGLPSGTTVYSITMTDNAGGPISYCGATPEGKMSYVDGSGAPYSWHGSDLWCFDEGTAR